MRYGRLYVFAAGDTWEPELLYNLTNCEGRGQRGSHRRHPVGNRPLTPPLASPVCHRQSRRQASRSRRRRPATWALRWWAGLCSNGGPMTAGSATLSPFSTHAAPFRTWLPTPSRLWRCTARQTRYSTPPPTAAAGCFSRRTGGGRGRGLRPRPPRPQLVPKFEFGR